MTIRQGADGRYESSTARGSSGSSDATAEMAAAAAAEVIDDDPTILIRKSDTSNNGSNNNKSTQNNNRQTPDNSTRYNNNNKKPTITRPNWIMGPNSLRQYQTLASDISGSKTPPQQGLESKIGAAALPQPPTAVANNDILPVPSSNGRNHPHNNRSNNSLTQPTTSRGSRHQVGRIFGMRLVQC